MARKFAIQDDFPDTSIGITGEYQLSLRGFFSFLAEKDIELTDEEFVSIVNLQPSQSLEVKNSDGNLKITRIS